ncbi:MAG TPA: hypothetical protein VHV75_07580 [Solirubrobacteraceae bacterium]|nr:hypothetical protein [Solirubrobacteraceae bacterium]
MRSAAVLVLAVAALAAPASALAAPELGAPIPTAHVAQASGGPTLLQQLNVASDKSALNAYASYLAAVVKGATAGQTSDADYVATISSQCKSALAGLSQPDSELDTAAQATLTALGEEMGDDLSINFDQAALTPFLKLSTNLSRLRWTHLSGGGMIVKRFLNAETNVLGLTTSALCQDAYLAASDPETLPTESKLFTKSYTRTSAAANTALTNLLKLMQTYETPSEKAVVLRIANLASQVTKLTKSDLMSSGSALTSTLESS